MVDLRSRLLEAADRVVDLVAAAYGLLAMTPDERAALREMTDG